jgi:hypothetical protein
MDASATFALISLTLLNVLMPGSAVRLLQCAAGLQKRTAAVTSMAALHEGVQTELLLLSLLMTHSSVSTQCTLTAAVPSKTLQSMHAAIVVI